jgi:1-acyl-sn-glycerol-3-phosphate acyltransferase
MTGNICTWVAPTQRSCPPRPGSFVYSAMPDAYILHRVVRSLAGWAVWSFFTEVHVIGGENVPKDGPIIV